MWQTVVLIPKGLSRYFRLIGLVEVLWKKVTSLLNRQLKIAIKLQDVLHMFWSVLGVGAAVLEAKLPQQISDMREVVRFKVLLELQKAYYILD